MTPAEVWFLRAGAAERLVPGRMPGLAMSKAYDHRSINGGIGEANTYLRSDLVAADFVDTFTPEYSAKGALLGVSGMG